MLILEGPDMVGKTTIANSIADAFGLTIDKFGLPEAENYKSVEQWQSRYNFNQVCDRYFISEFIYGIICRGKANLDPVQVERLCHWCQQTKQEMIIISATPDAYEKLLEKYYDPGREAFSADQCRQVNQAYQELALFGSWRGYNIAYMDRVHYQIKLDWEGKEVVRPSPYDIGSTIENWMSTRPRVKFASRMIEKSEDLEVNGPKTGSDS